MKLCSQICILLPSSLSRRYCLSGSWKTDFCTDILDDSIIPDTTSDALSSAVYMYLSNMKLASYYRL